MDGTGRDWMGHNRIGWDRTGLDGTGPDWMGQDGIGWDRTGLDGTGPCWIGHGRIGWDVVGMNVDGACLDWMGHDRIGGDKAVSYGIVGQVVTVTKVIFQVIDCFVTRLGLFTFLTNKAVEFVRIHYTVNNQ